MKRSGFSRPPFARMARIHALLLACQPVSSPIVARELEVSAKTAQRDIDFMRDQLGLPIDYDVSRHTFVYTEPVTRPLFGAWKEAA